MFFLPELITWITQGFVFGQKIVIWPVFPIIILLASLPFIIKWCRWLNKNWFTGHDNEPVILFALAGLCWTIAYLIYGNSTLDIYSRGGYYIILYSPLVLYILLVFYIFCIFYYAWTVISKLQLNIKFSRIHFWVTYIGLDLSLGMRHTDITGIGPRHYVEYKGWTSFYILSFFNTYMLAILIIVVIAQFVFLFNIISSFLIKAEK